MRRTPFLLRTSRHSPGGWTEPSPRHSAAFVRTSSDSSASLSSSSPSASGSMRRVFGVEDFSMVDRQHLTLTNLMRLMVDATFRPKDPDSRAFGGDGATQRAALREELKTMDHRLSPFTHDALLSDYLKNVLALSGPSGQRFTREVLRGRLVGLLFCSESERSRGFMPHLQRFHSQHGRDFVVVAISLGGREMVEWTRQYGFFHCSHRDGATWVQRDAGLMVRPFTPLPRLIIVHGTSGEEICRSGLTAVLTHPETCLEAWRKGHPGHAWWDCLKTFYI